MFRSVAQAQQLRRVVLAAQHRSFVSTVLLSRTWENETVVELRKEARNRGLSTKGNKSTLITRIREYEVKKVAPTSENPSVASTRETPAASRRASTQAANAPTTTSSSAPKAASPGIPPSAEPRSGSIAPDFLCVKLPDLSQSTPETPVQVPYLPDFWDSARLKPKTAPTDEPELPKLHVVSGPSTHPYGGPTYNLEKDQEADAVASTVPSADEAPKGEPKQTGTGIGMLSFWREVADDIGLPRTIRWTPAQTNPSSEQQHTYSRPLNEQERRGLYVLLGLVVGSWVVGGVVNRSPRPPVEEEEHARAEH
ncbi:hypothetical protein F5I97DRAFT_485600 [Phlebopus sp. FC_14]|nr:hypothetical protein F5I97DRAFT_485600 [Phlebopus sp. FC_14]